jgi:hypothetical protein
MEDPLKRHRLTTVGGLAAMVVAAAALAPGALAAGQAHTCADKVFVIETPGPAGTIKNKLPVKAISTQGVSCAAAYKFIGLAFKNMTSTYPEHYKCKTGHFKVPLGYVPQVCTKPGAKIQYAVHGG